MCFDEMIIRVLPNLNSRAAWIDFCRREVPYCFVEDPACLVDFQSTHLQITLLPDGCQEKDAIKYSIGSRTSVEPAWSLIRACNWELGRIIHGLEQMDFGSNVRDNSLLGVHTELTARKFFARERSLTTPSALGLLKPLDGPPAEWNNDTLLRLISHHQYRGLRCEQLALPGAGNTHSALSVPSRHSLRLMLMEHTTQWRGQLQRERLFLYREQQPMLSLIPDYRAPAPRLKPRSRTAQV